MFNSGGSLNANTGAGAIGAMANISGGFNVSLSHYNTAAVNTSGASNNDGASYNNVTIEETHGNGYSGQTISYTFFGKSLAVTGSNATTGALTTGETNGGVYGSNTTTTVVPLGQIDISPNTGPVTAPPSATPIDDMSAARYRLQQ
jgi:hypothetical protein